MAGDLARDMKGAAHFPKPDADKCTITKYLCQREACKEALGAFNHVWNSYVEEVLKNTTNCQNRKDDLQMKLTKEMKTFLDFVEEGYTVEEIELMLNRDSLRSREIGTGFQMIRTELEQLRPANKSQGFD